MLEETEWNPEKNSIEESMKYLAYLIDEAEDTLDAQKAYDALEKCKALEGKLNIKQESKINYFRANAWSAIRHVNHRNINNVWDWEQEAIFNEVYWLRSAIKSEGFELLDKLEKCQILTNTGNILSHIGRIIEAIEYWQRAINIIPNFAMAIGNLGHGLSFYARMMYDPGHSKVILNKAYQLLISLKDSSMLWESYYSEEMKNEMIKESENIKRYINCDEFDESLLNSYSLGGTQTEITYRTWVLNENLFLSTLNDIGHYSIAAHDILHLPSIVISTGKQPYLFGFFNQLKQEYISSRFILWEGLNESIGNERHFSDNDVLLYETGDFTINSFGLEKIKISFRMSYSLFDKIAFFINDYFSLNMPEHEINFQSIWFEKSNKNLKKELKGCFKKHGNLALRGLYWISKDFIDRGAEISLGSVMEPDAEKLRSIRNSLEHKYLKVHLINNDELHSLDPLASHIVIDDLIQKTIRVLKLARASLIYLSLAIHQNERIKNEYNNAMPIPLRKVEN